MLAAPSRRGGTADTAHESDSDADETKGRTCRCRRTRGNLFLVYGRANRSFPLVCLVGPDALCNVVTLAVIVGPSLAALVHARGLHISLQVALSFSFSLVLGSFMQTAYSDPGIVRKQSKAELEAAGDGDATFCDTCCVYQDPGVRHCWDCGVCIRDFDHHCAWMGQCVGKNNQRSFNVFLICVVPHFTLIFVAFSLARHFAEAQERTR